MVGYARAPRLLISNWLLSEFWSPKLLIDIKNKDENQYDNLALEEDNSLWVKKTANLSVKNLVILGLASFYSM